jgi:hypothetical protein
MGGDKFFSSNIDALSGQFGLSISNEHQRESECTDGDCSDGGDCTVVGLQKTYDTPEEIAHNTKHRSPLIAWGFFLALLAIARLAWAAAHK